MRTSEDHKNELRKERVLTAFPFYTAALIWIVWGLFLPVRGWIGILLPLLLSVAAYVLADRFGPKIYRFVEPPEPEIKTGSAEHDAVLEKAREDLKQLAEVESELRDPDLREKTSHLRKIGEGIVDHLRKHPEKIRQTSRFLSYYLPTTVRILHQYHELSETGIEGENISQSRTAIKKVIDKLVEGYEGQYDHLYADEALDLSADIDVLEALLKQDDLLKESKGHE